MRGNKKYIDYPRPDVLPQSAAEARTIAEHMDLVLRATQADMVESGNKWLHSNDLPGSLSQGQLSALRRGNEPHPTYWPLYMAALEIEDAGQFYRLMRNSARIAAYMRVESLPLLDWLEFENSREGLIARFKNGPKVGAGGSDGNRSAGETGGRSAVDSDALEDAGRARNTGENDAERLRESEGRTGGTHPHAALVQTQR